MGFLRVSRGPGTFFGLQELPFVQEHVLFSPVGFKRNRSPLANITGVLGCTFGNNVDPEKIQKNNKTTCLLIWVPVSLV